MTETVGIVVEATDKASSVLAGIGKAGKSSMDAVRLASEKTGNAIKAVGIASAIANQTLELGKKGFELFRMAILDTVTAAFEFRDAMDPAVVQVKEFGTQLQTVRARVGDVMIPMLQGLADAFGPVIDNLIEWINLNRVMIGTNLVEWLDTVANVLITGVARGVLLVTKAWTGLQEVVQVVSFLFEKQFELIARGVESSLGYIGRLAAAVGADGLAATVRSAEDSVRALGDEFERSGDASLSKVAELAAQQEAFEKNLDSVEKAARRVWGEAAVAMVERLKQSVTGLSTTEAQRAAAAKRHAAELQVISDANVLSIRMQGEAWSRAADDSEAYAKQLEADQAATLQVVAGMATTVASAWSTAALAMADGSKTAGQAAMDASLASAETMLNTAAVVAMGEAIKAHAGIPIVGVAIGTAVAGTVFALIKSKLSQLPKAERGFRVRGGIPGVDSVPIMAQSGEAVLDPRQTKIMDRFVAALESGRGSSGGGMGGGNVYVQYTDASAVPAQSADTKRKLREVGNGLARMRKRGM